MMATYAIDWTGRFAGAPTAVVRPGTGHEVAALVTLCREAGVALVPQGGNTGLVGGSVPLSGEVVLSLRRLGGVSDIDSLGGQLSAGAGTTVADVQAAAAAAGWAYGVDLASRDSATIGGTIATNAGGLQVLRYGATRGQLVGFEAVLGTGDTVSHMGGLVKDNTGYDLGGLLCGSEGTLGVVTAARGCASCRPTRSASLRSSPSPPRRRRLRRARCCGGRYPNSNRSSSSFSRVSNSSAVSPERRTHSANCIGRICWSRRQPNTTRCPPWPPCSTPSP